jgi:hypothetical protein
LTHLICRVDDYLAGEGIAMRRGQFGYGHPGKSQYDNVGSRQRVTDGGDLRRGTCNIVVLGMTRTQHDILTRVSQ